MHDWLTIELVLATLLVTSFTCVGLLALWAATSPWHWFMRTAFILAVISPLLLVPAYEPYLVLLLQAGVVVTGTKSWRLWRAKNAIVGLRSTDDAFVADRAVTGFSVRTLLLLTAIVAVTVAIAARISADLPTQNLESWTTIVLHGLTSGGAILLGGWVVVSKRKQLALPVAFVLGLVMAVLFAWHDWFILSIMQRYWPPDSSIWQQWQQSAGEYASIVWWRTVTVCIATILATILASYFLIVLWLHRVSQRAIVGIALILPAILPGYVLLRLLNPKPIPQSNLPQPNGWDDLIAAGKMIKTGSPILNTMVEPASTDELAAEIAKFAPAYDRIRLALSRPCQVPLWPANRTVGRSGNVVGLLNELQSVRAVARALMLEAELAQQQGRFDDAARISIETIGAAHDFTRGGLLVHLSVGIACEGIGQSTLYQTIAHLDAETCRKTVAALEQIEQSRESLSEVLARDRIWDENASGWHGHLLVILDDMANNYGETHAMVQRGALPITQAINRLLMVKLALRQYELAHDRWPEDLVELVPEILNPLPSDPFSVNGQPLRYSRSAEGYLLYSVGFDGDDDGGRPPAKREYGHIEWRDEGDLLLDAYFASQEDDMEEGEENRTESTDAMDDHYGILK